MVAIKQENISLKSELKSEIKTMRSDLNRLHMDITADFSEVRTLISTNAQSIDRVCSERSNGVASLKSDIKQMKADIKSISDDHNRMSFKREVVETEFALNFNMSDLKLYLDENGR